MNRMGLSIYKRVQQWCSENEWKHPYLNNGWYWAVPPGAKISMPLPENFIEFQKKEIALIRCWSWLEENPWFWYFLLLVITLVLALCDPRSIIYAGIVSIPSLQFVKALLLIYYVYQLVCIPFTSSRSGLADKSKQMCLLYIFVLIIQFLAPQMSFFPFFN